MSKGIIAGVGTARGFDRQGNMVLKGRALTDSGFNISTSKEEIRGGQGAGLQGQYFHTTQFAVNLKDAIFDLNYLALQVGGIIKQGGDIFETEEVVVEEGGEITVVGTPKAFGKYGIIGWYNKVGEDTNKKITFSEKTARDIEAQPGDTICVTYVKTSDSAKAFEVTTAFIPSEIQLVLEMPIFSAGATSKEQIGTASQIGKLTVDVPRFQFNGSVDLSTTMTGSAGVDASGMALQSGTSSCSGKGIYATITENIEGRGEFENVFAIVVEDSDVDLAQRETQTLNVMALYNDGTVPNLIDNKKLTFTVESGSSAQVGKNTGLVTAQDGTGATVIEVKVTDKPALTAKAVVTVE